MSRRRIAALAAALAVVGSACGAGAEVGSVAAPAATESVDAGTVPTPPAPAGDTPPASAPGEVPQAAIEALSFTAPALAGGVVDGTEYAGRDVVLWMWAPW